ncbi:MAG: MFS transporter [Candidatus Methanodesulfokora sp.]|jgi:MFS family permease
MQKKLLIAFMALSFVSLFADATYEGARSVIGSYIEYIGATAVIAGLVGVGEFLGYVFRLLGGVVAGRSRSSKVYWSIVFLGYGVNLVAVPLLAFARNWTYVILLVFLERIGKGLRQPSRDVILSEVTEGIGRGKGFGIHELLDQIGALIGPIIVAYALYLDGYSLAFLILSIPALLAIISLSIGYASYPEVKAVRKSTGSGKTGRIFWIYSAAMALFTMGFMHWSIVSYHLKAANLASDEEIALIYALAMASDAVMALPAGIMYDKAGIASVLIAPVAAFLEVPLFLSGNSVLAAVVWGIAMGAYETNIRAAVADLVEAEGRAYAYGIFGFLTGGFWMAGSLLMGLLYEINRSFIIHLSLISEVLSFLLLLALRRSSH